MKFWTEMEYLQLISFIDMYACWYDPVIKYLSITDLDTFTVKFINCIHVGNVLHI